MVNFFFYLDKVIDYSEIFEYKHDINIKEFENICMSYMNTGTAIFLNCRLINC